MISDGCVYRRCGCVDPATGRQGRAAPDPPSPGGGLDAVPDRAVAADRKRPPVAMWTAQQTAQFLASIEDHRLYAAYHLIALRGLRSGEAARRLRCGHARCRRERGRRPA